MNQTAFTCLTGRWAVKTASADGASRLRRRERAFTSTAGTSGRRAGWPLPAPACLAAALVLTLISASGCSSTLRSRLSYATTNDSVEIYLQPAFGMPQHATLAILSFSAPAYATAAANVVTEAYYQEILRSGGFRQVTLVRELPPAQRDLPPWKVLKDYDLVLQGEIVYVLAGTGSSPTQLQVDLRMVDVSRGTMAWYLRQQCISQPGQEVDLIWKTVPGESATAYQNMATLLARKFVQIITALPENQTESRPQTYPQGSPGVDSSLD